jgi:Ca2+-binding RTX toxin-like protein
VAASYIEALLFQPFNTINPGVKEWRWNNTVGTGETGLGTAVDVTFRFTSEVPVHAVGSGDATGYQPLTEAQKTAARTILGIYEQYCNIDFVESPGLANADMLISRNSASPAGYAYAPELLTPAGVEGDDGGDIWLSVNDANLDVGVGGPGWNTLIHEIGHAIGLKHPFEVDDRDGAGGFPAQPALPDATDSNQYTVMSYTGHARSLLRVVAEGGGSVSYEYLGSSTPMLYDVAAIQYLYGKNMATGAGNTVYTFDPNTPFFKCIWDASGSDTISVSTFTRGCTIDLNAGKFSSISIPTEPLPGGFGAESPDILAQIYDGTNNLSIAFGAVIEKAIGGSGADKLTGNAVANTLTGNGGNDNLTGNAGNDTMNGGAGNDIINGGVGTDKIKGDAGTDTITYGAGDAIDGGLGNLDVLKIASGSLNLTTLINTRILNIEKINMTAGGANTLTINAADVLALSSTVNTLSIMGDAADTVDLVGTFTLFSTVGNIETWKSGSAIVTIETEINVI